MKVTQKTNRITKHGVRASHAGFTLIEVIAVIAIIAILAAVAIPSMISFIEHGKQVGRMNIARTLYLAAQNQLTKGSIDKSLKSTMTGQYFQKDINGFYTDLLDDTKKGTRNVAQALAANGGTLPIEEASNADYIRYISKPKDYSPPTDAEIDAMSNAAEKAEANELRSFYSLLDEIIIDKSILNDAILMEYNIKTGIVLSIFYGDAFNEGQMEFAYLNEADNDKTNVTGGRGSDGGYQYTTQRRQGYYGVESTGKVPPPSFSDIINIYDGTEKPLDIGSGKNKVNVLYVELMLAKQYMPDGVTEALMPSYTFELVNAKTLNSVISAEVDGLNESGFPKNFDLVFNNQYDSQAVYHDTVSPVVVEQNGIDVGGYYNRYIWVIDYIDGDILSGQPHSIGIKYKDGEGRPIEPQNVRAKVSKVGGAESTSLSFANTHFNREQSGGGYEIKSARHLNNIRYKINGEYRQTQDIDMMAPNNEITNFAPIIGVNSGAFSGKYYAMKSSSAQYKIINLRVNSNQANVGLFANVGGNSCIQGISLYKAVISAINSDNVGAIAGIMTGGTVKQCNSYANITVSSNKSANVGGLVGRISSGTLEQSFNAGFYNAPDKPQTSEGFGSVTANRGNIGGLVGLSYGTIQNCFNNARVNVDNVSVTKDGEMFSYDPIFTQLSATAFVGGIAGYNNGGTIKNTYATNFVSMVANFGSSYGGIAGISTGSFKLDNNFFLANGCARGSGSEAVSKKQLQANPCGSLFAKGVAAEYDNLYKDYPYPTLKSNNPFADHSYDWVRYPSGWEDIEDLKVSDTGLLYYELYNNNTTGFSAGDLAPLVSSGSNELVISDGYVLEIKGNASSAITVVIGAKTYELTITDSPALSCEWKDEDNNAVAATNSIVGYTDDESNQIFLLFFDNSFLEGHANGGAYIDFEVQVFEDTIISVRFNPLFANTVGRTLNIFSVRSPRHFDNINKALDTSCSQGLSLDFTAYHKTAAYTYQAGAAAVTGTVTGTTLNYADNTAIVNSPFAGEYNGNRFFIKAAKADKGLFANISAAASVSAIRLIGSSIGQGNAAGGIAAENNGTIHSCEISDVTISGSSDLGIAVGINNGSIMNTLVENSQISGSNSERRGGIAGTNNGRIESCTVRGGSEIAGNYSVGGIAGENTGIISECLVESSGVSVITYNAGGVAGNNTGSIFCSGVSYTTVKSVIGNTVGGIVGNNGVGGRVEDVYFLSTNDSNNSPISAPDGVNNGGIVGGNAGSVSRVLYLAPAPSVTTESTTTIYPIVGSGNSETAGFFLQGHRYSLDEGNHWIESDYNRIYAGSLVISGQGKGLVTNFIEHEWLNYAYKADMSNWYQPTTGYPYPVPVGLEAPQKWPEADAPARPDQLDRLESDPWETTLSTANRAANVSFINGGFSLPLMDPSNPGLTYDILRIPEITTAPSSTQSDSANLTRGGFNTSTNSGIPSDASPTQKNGSDYYGMYIYYNADYVQGWNTRPVSGTSSTYSNMIEFQRPYSSSLSNAGRYGRVRTNYEGTLTGAYIELNAEVPGTLYQIAPTVPGTELYYSFYHARRNAGNETGGVQRMNFYLSGMVKDSGGNWVYTDGSGRPTIIRPCITPRGTSLASAATRNTVVYGTTAANSAEETVTVGRVDFYDPKINGTRNAYLIDVWVSGLDYGITFWTDSLPNSTPIGDNNVNRIPTAGVINITTAKTTSSGSYLPASLLSAAQNNVIGYWHVEQFATNQYSEWKQYYGQYSIPEGQVSTEFAYESASMRNAQEGNYLDGITFQSPGFLSIEKYIRMGDTNVSFVKPGDTLTVELDIKNWGEVSVDNIKIIDRLSPFDAYISYAGNVKIGGTTVVSGVEAPDASNNHTLTITLPANTTLQTNEELSVSFDIKVNQYVTGNSGVSTLLYYFKNQAVVTYYDVDYAGYSKTNANTDYIKKNASGPQPAQVFIDPVELLKTVTPNTQGPFSVELMVQNADENNILDTTGMVTDLIPKGFVISDKGNLPSSTLFTQNTDGSTRIIIRDVNLSSAVTRLKYTYELKYEGSGYGVTYTSLSTDYKYLATLSSETVNVMLLFPQPVVGISAKTTDDVFSINTTGTTILDILKNDNFSERLTSDNYDILTEIILFDENMSQVSVNGNGDYQINHANYTATLIKSTNQLLFAPKSSVNDEFEFYYQIKSTAKKSGGTLNDTDLSSRITKVTVRVINDVVMYYEKYSDETYGFYGESASSLLPALHNTKLIVESGYCVLSAQSGKSAQLGGGAVSSLSESYNSMHIYKLDTPPTVNLDLLTVKFGAAESMSVIGKIHPNFAKAVYSAAAENAGNMFYIRTPQQMRNIGLVDATGITFAQECDLDFDNIDLNAAGAVVGGIFNGTFNGNGFAIKNATIDALSIDNVGIFSRNSGTISGVALKPDTNIRGKDNTGGIAGHNLERGLIKECTVEGRQETDNSGTYTGMHIEGNLNVGGITGLNDGKIEDCIVRNTTQTIKGYDFVGGISGFNSVSGIISGSSVSNVRLESAGDNVGEIAEKTKKTIIIRKTNPPACLITLKNPRDLAESLLPLPGFRFIC